MNRDTRIVDLNFRQVAGSSQLTIFFAATKSYKNASPTVNRTHRSPAWAHEICIMDGVRIWTHTDRSNMESPADKSWNVISYDLTGEDLWIVDKTNTFFLDKMCKVQKKWNGDRKMPCCGFSGFQKLAQEQRQRQFEFTQ